MDAYLEGYISAEYKGIIEELFNYEHRNKSISTSKEATKLKPLRGFGRYKSSHSAVSESGTGTFSFEKFGTLKGLGRKQSFYDTLSQWFDQKKKNSTEQSPKTYSYWRGLKSF